MKYKAIVKGRVGELRWCHKSYKNDVFYSYKYTVDDVVDYYTYINNNKNCNYHFSRIGRFELYRTFKNNIWETIWEGELNDPLLEVEDEFYVDNLSISVKITKRQRHQDGKVVYETDYIVRDIKDEETEKSRLKAVDEWFFDNYVVYKTWGEVGNPIIQTFEELQKYEESLMEKDEDKEELVSDWLVTTKENDKKFIYKIFNLFK